MNFLFPIASLILPVRILIRRYFCFSFVPCTICIPSGTFYFPLVLECYLGYVVIPHGLYLNISGAGDGRGRGFEERLLDGNLRMDIKHPPF